VRETDLTLKLEARAESVAVVRRALEVLLGGTPARPELVADAKTGVTEACMNVVRHAYPGGGGQMEVLAWLRDEGLRVAVRDTGRGFGAGGRSAGGAGLGLFLISSLADELDIRSDPRIGTEVGMEFAFNGDGRSRPIRAGGPALSAIGV
jgi:serine/threonine-protein kinase RsbW